MEDEKIIELYNQRNEKAIAETADKFGKMLYCIAMNILSVKEDSEETVNDTYIKAWDNIPPQFPNSLGAWLGKITRNLSISRIRKNRAQKRSGIEIMLSELEECIPSFADTETEAESREIAAVLNSWLNMQSREDRILFVRRYWYGDSVAKLSEKADMSAKKLSSRLFRLRKNLKNHLEEEGIFI